MGFYLSSSGRSPKTNLSWSITDEIIRINFSVQLRSSLCSSLWLDGRQQVRTDPDDPPHCFLIIRTWGFPTKTNYSLQRLSQQAWYKNSPESMDQYPPDRSTLQRSSAELLCPLSRLQKTTECHQFFVFFFCRGCFPWEREVEWCEEFVLKTPQLHINVFDSERDVHESPVPAAQSSFIQSAEDGKYNIKGELSEVVIDQRHLGLESSD